MESFNDVTAVVPEQTGTKPPRREIRAGPDKRCNTIYVSAMDSWSRVADFGCLQQPKQASLLDPLEVRLAVVQNGIFGLASFQLTSFGN